MYSHHGDYTLIDYPYTDDFSLLDMTTVSQSNISQEGGNGLDTISYNAVCGNEGSSYVSPMGLSTSLLQQSISSHLFEKNITSHTSNNGLFSRMGLASESESLSNQVRRVFSAGDLQKINAAQRFSRSESPLSSESSSIIESMTRAYPYTPKEKKERIERYRSKRSLRNFTKKIKYECRKTLADSRPRVRGRFAKNDETENSSQSSQWSHEYVEEDGENSDNWLIFLDSFSANLVP